ncbi:MAG: TrkH family potassium uptake protein [Bacteroidales bacterium]|nr:TrkH family potassium uptake protein [Bacteroidales bacterium]
MKYILRFLGIVLMVEGVLMLSCLVPALHFDDGTAGSIALSGAFTVTVGLWLRVTFGKARVLRARRMAYLLVVLMWVVLALFGMLPFLTTGTLTGVEDALFESMSGITSTGATVFSAVEWLPASVLFWRSMTQWFGGFGIVLLVLAVVPSLGINKYSLYTAEASGADNTGKQSATMGATVRQTLGVYVLLTGVFVWLLYKSGMQVWDAVNITFTNISSGGFSIYNNSLERLTHGQQYIVAAAMLLSGVNFAMLYNLLTFRWDRLRHKVEQLRFYLLVAVVCSLFVVVSLVVKMGYGVGDALRCGVVQTVSVLTTTGSLVADTSGWWVPVTFLYVVLSMCGGMAGSTTGGLKAMRVLILVRHVSKTLRDRLHPRAVSPVRLNGTPVRPELATNVMVCFMVFVMVCFVGIMLLMVCGINATESIGAVVACMTGYGPGLGTSGGFGCYAHFTLSAKLVCSLLMLMGRLECLTVVILFTPAFFKMKIEK